MSPQDEAQSAARKGKIMARLMEYSGFTILSAMRAMMANIVWRGIEARLAWRENPRRSPHDKTVDGRGVFPMERIRKYVADGYAPFWMQKGIVDPWVPIDRWDTPSRMVAKDTPETAWFM